MLRSLPQRQQGAIVYAPLPADEGHFKTYLEMQTAVPPPQFSPSEGLRGVIGRCSEPGCLWVIASAADRDRHIRLVHRKKESSPPRKPETQLAVSVTRTVMLKLLVLKMM